LRIVSRERDRMSASPTVAQTFLPADFKSDYAAADKNVRPTIMEERKRRTRQKVCPIVACHPHGDTANA